MENNKISLESDGSVNKDGKPLFEWELDATTGEIIDTRRKPDSDSERIIERQVDPASLINDNVQKKLEELEKSAPAHLKPASASDISESSSQAEGASGIDWESLDMQRDIAFKVVYFFIVFIIATFGLLYAYFQMNKKEEEELQRQYDLKHGPRSKAFGNNDTFFDFLAGHHDDEALTAASRANRTPSDAQSAFGSGNLESLGEQPVFYQH